MCTQLLGWVLAERWGVARCFGQLSHDHSGQSRALASDRQAPLQMACGGKQGRDPPCWFIRIQTHLAEDWSCHWNTEVLFCTFIEVHSVQSGTKFTEHDMWNVLIQNCGAVVVQGRAEGDVFLGEPLEHEDSGVSIPSSHHLWFIN